MSACIGVHRRFQTLNLAPSPAMPASQGQRGIFAVSTVAAKGCLNVQIAAEVWFLDGPLHTFQIAVIDGGRNQSCERKQKVSDA